VAFQERDVAQDPGALPELKKLGYMTTPVIVIDGSVIVGFDNKKIDQALQS
jgi:glutaredoxin